MTTTQMTPARRRQRADRAYRSASWSLNQIKKNAAHENTLRGEWLTAARLEVANAVRAWGLHSPSTAQAIRYAHAVEAATEACADQWSRHLATAEQEVKERRRRAQEVYAETA